LAVEVDSFLLTSQTQALHRIVVADILPVSLVDNLANLGIDVVVVVRLDQTIVDVVVRYMMVRRLCHSAAGLVACPEKDCGDHIGTKAVLEKMIVRGCVLVSMVVVLENCRNYEKRYQVGNCLEEVHRNILLAGCCGWNIRSCYPAYLEC
jgi:hypothetical protein